MNYETIGKNIDEIRKARGITIDELSQRVGVSKTSVYRNIADGKLSLGRLANYAEVLGCTIGDLTSDAVDREKFWIGTELKDRWPYNLVNAVLGNPDDPDTIYSVYIPGFIASLDELTAREKGVLEMRFGSCMTLDETGKVFGVTKERIRQVEARAIRKLRNPCRWRRWKLDTVNRYIEAEMAASAAELQNITLMREKHELEERLNIENKEYVDAHKLEIKHIPIEDMELSVRTYNCLRRANINYVSDLDGKSTNYLRKIRNLGWKSMKEVIAKAREFGVEIFEEESYVG